MLFRSEAKSALIVGLKAKRHHIRTACIKTLVKFDDKDLVYFIEPLLNDSAYETRIEAKKAIFSLTGINLETSRGE